MIRKPSLLIFLLLFSLPGYATIVKTFDFSGFDADIDTTLFDDLQIAFNFADATDFSNVAQDNIEQWIWSFNGTILIGDVTDSFGISEMFALSGSELMLTIGYVDGVSRFMSDSANSLLLKQSAIPNIFAGDSWEYLSQESFTTPAIENSPVSAVPEPSIFALLSLGLMGLFVMRRRAHHKPPTC